MTNGTLLALRRTTAKDTKNNSGNPEGTRWKPLERTGKTIGDKDPSNTKETGF